MNWGVSMKKVIKIGFPIACVIIIGGTFYMLNDLNRQVEESLRSQYSNTTNTSNENEITENEGTVQENVSYTLPVNPQTEDDENEVNSNSVSNEIDEEELNTTNNINENEE